MLLYIPLRFICIHIYPLFPRRTLYHPLLPKKSIEKWNRRRISKSDTVSFSGLFQTIRDPMFHSLHLYVGIYINQSLILSSRLYAFVGRFHLSIIVCVFDRGTDDALRDDVLLKLGQDAIYSTFRSQPWDVLRNYTNT